MSNVNIMSDMRNTNIRPKYMGFLSISQKSPWCPLGVDVVFLSNATVGAVVVAPSSTEHVGAFGDLGSTVTDLEFAILWSMWRGLEFPMGGNSCSDVESQPAMVAIDRNEIARYRFNFYNTTYLYDSHPIQGVSAFMIRCKMRNTNVLIARSTCCPVLTEISM